MERRENLKNSKIYYYISCTNGNRAKRAFICTQSERKRERRGEVDAQHDIALSVFTLQITNNRSARTSIPAKMTARFCFRKL